MTGAYISTIDGLIGEIVRVEIMFGNIRIRCPDDKTEHEVPAGTKEFRCPIGGELLIIPAAGIQQ